MTCYQESGQTPEPEPIWYDRERVDYGSSDLAYEVINASQNAEYTMSLLSYLNLPRKYTLAGTLFIISNRMVTMTGILYMNLSTTPLMSLSKDLGTEKSIIVLRKMNGDLYATIEHRERKVSTESQILCGDGALPLSPWLLSVLEDLDRELKGTNGTNTPLQKGKSLHE